MEPDSIEEIFEDVLFEVERARDQYADYHSLHEAWAVIYEEVDELWEIVRERGSHQKGFHGRQECIQIAATAIRAIIDRGLE